MRRRVVSILLVMALILTSGDFTGFAAEQTKAVESAVEEETVKETCSIDEEEFVEEEAVELEIAEESETENEEMIDSSESTITTETKENDESISIIGTEDVSEEEFLSETEIEESDLLIETETENVLEEDKRELDNSMTEGDFTYIISDETATITGYTGSGGTVIVPSVLGGVIVTSIGNSAFKGSAMSDIVLPDSITSIGNYAFSGCSSLDSLALPKHLTSIGYRIIEGTTIISITIPKNVTNCSHYYYSGRDDPSDFDGPLSNCSTLTEVIFEEGMETIPSYVLSTGFWHASYITKVIVPESVIAIGDRAFYNCEKIKDIELPKGLISIGNYAFSGCRSLSSLILPENLNNMGYLMIEDTMITSITIPKNVISCGCYPYKNNNCSGPLSNCSTLTEVVFEEGMEAIPSYALSVYSNHTSYITKVIIPTSVTTIGVQAFYNCNKIKDIKLPPNLTNIGNYAFSGCSSLNALELPEGLTSIGNYAFSNCSLLNSLTLPKSLTSMGYQMIENTAITKITIPKNVTSCSYNKKDSYSSGYIDCAGPLSNCSTLTEVAFEQGIETIPSYILSIRSDHINYVTKVDIPVSVTEIGEYAFSNCEKINDIKLPKALDSIGCGAFYGCSSLNSLTLSEKISKIENFTFSGCSSLNALKLPEGLTSIGNYAFSGCSSLNTLELPEGLTSIGNYAFSGCSSLNALELPEGLTSIGNYAFNYCTKLSTLELPKNLEQIGYCMIAKTQISSISIPKSLTKCEVYIKGNVALAPVLNQQYAGPFANCPTLTNVILEEGMETVPNYIFASVIYDSYITEIQIPNSIKYIGTFAFAGCTELTKLNLPENIEYIDDFAFWGCKSLISLNLPPNIKSLGENIIGYTSISTIIMPQNLKEGTHSLANCDTLTDVIFEEGMQKIPFYMLDTSQVVRVVIPQSVTEIEGYAFSNCKSLADIYYAGNEKEWKKIKIGSDNDALNNATIHYNSSGPKDGFYFSATTPTTCIKIGESLGFDVQYYEKDKFDTSIENVIHVVSDSNVIDVTPGNWSNTEGKHYTIKAKSLGYSTITFTNPNNGEASALELYVVEKETGYALDNVPKFTVEKGKTTNFYNYSGLVVDELKYVPCKDSNGNIDYYYVTMNVYNTLNLYAVVTSYDCNGNQEGFYIVDKMKTQPSNLTGNVKDAYYNIGDLCHLIGNKQYYSGKSISKKTEVEINVPVGGHIEISNSAMSETVVLTNMVGLIIDNMASSGEFVTGAYDFSESETEIINAVLMEVFSEKNLAKMITKTVKKSAIEELKHGNWNYTNYGDCLNAFMNRLTNLGVDIVDVIADKVASVTGLASITESVVMRCIPTGDLINFLYDTLGVLDSLNMWDSYIKSVNFPEGIYIYAPGTSTTLMSNGVSAALTGTPKPNTIIHAYLVLDTSEISGSKYQTYNINMYRDGQKIQPDAPVNVQIPIPLGYNKSSIKVYRLNDDGTLTDMNATAIDGYASFTTDHFSYYALVSGNKGGIFLANWKFDEKSTITLSDPEKLLNGKIAVYAASYDKNGKMLDIVEGSDFIYDNLELNVTFTRNLTNNWELFILDSATYTPLCPSITFPKEKN